MASSPNYIKGVFDGSVTRHKLPAGYYNSLSDELRAAVRKGFGRDAKKYADLFEDLDINAQAFAGAKTYNLIAELELTRDMSSNWAEYEAKAREIDKQFHTWGDAEINTATQQASQARQWAIIEDDSDLFPILQYSAIGDACKICKPLDKLTARFDSPIWAKVYPCNHYHCYCIVTQHKAGEVELTDKKTTAGLVLASTDKMGAVFKSNPGKTGKIYTAKHPYFESIPKDDRAFAKSNFGFEIK